MFALKFALGTVASITAWFPSENSAEIFGFLALTFVAQNLVVARRTIWQGGTAVRRVPADARR
jgi:hypothetical protein